MRERLPNRRFSEVIHFAFIDAEHVRTPCTVSLGRFEDGRIGEVFIQIEKQQSMMGVLCHDSAVLISIALQHGASIQELRDSIARTDIENGKPQSVIGAVLDLMVAEEARP